LPPQHKGPVPGVRDDIHPGIIGRGPERLTMWSDSGPALYRGEKAL
jgi:hypothetical protein